MTNILTGPTQLPTVTRTISPNRGFNLNIERRPGGIENTAINGASEAALALLASLIPFICYCKYATPRRDRFGWCQTSGIRAGGLCLNKKPALEVRRTTAAKLSAAVRNSAPCCMSKRAHCAPAATSMATTNRK